LRKEFGGNNWVLALKKARSEVPRKASTNLVLSLFLIHTDWKSKWGVCFFHRVSHVKKGKGTRKMEWGLFPFPFYFYFYFSLYIESLKNFMTIIHESTFWWAGYSKLYDKKGNVFSRSFRSGCNNLVINIWWSIYNLIKGLTFLNYTKINPWLLFFL
jgi:hypothetical protein